MPSVPAHGVRNRQAAASGAPNAIANTIAEALAVEKTNAARVKEVKMAMEVVD